MTTYRVTWEIDLDAATPAHAAEQAQDIQRRQDSIASVFDVVPHAKLHLRRGERCTYHVDLTQGTIEIVVDQKYCNVPCTTCRARVGAHCVIVRGALAGTRLHGTHKTRIERSKRHGKKTIAAG